MPRQEETGSSESEAVHRTCHNWPVTLLSELAQAADYHHQLPWQRRFAPCLWYNTPTLVRECSAHDPDANAIEVHPYSLRGLCVT